MDVLKLATLAILMACPAIALADDAACETGGHLADVQCFSKKLEAANAELDQLYRDTLTKLPDSVATDNRKGKAQLIKAQEAWRNYLDAQCTFIGGIQGGSNLWVTDFANRCEFDEIKNRIDFFKHVPWGDH
jgi:uncharacterized protein YecT (DUF1311 family)